MALLLTRGVFMPPIVLADGRALDVSKVSDGQLKTSIRFQGSRAKPEIIEVVSACGNAIHPTKLVAGDTHSIWIQHQTDVIPRQGARPRVVTGLTPDEADQAKALFQALASGIMLHPAGVSSSGPSAIPASDAVQSGTPATGKPEVHPLWHPRHWVRDILIGVIVAVLAGVILAWLGLTR
jgi:hypothetical protein